MSDHGGNRCRALAGVGVELNFFSCASDHRPRNQKSATVNMSKNVSMASTPGKQHQNTWEKKAQTMKKLLLVVSLFLAVISHAAEPWQEPEDFRGFKWGVSIEEFKSTLGSRIGTANLWGNRIKNYFSRRQMIGPAEVDFEYASNDTGHRIQREKKSCKRQWVPNF
jgi:hypothetical protein